jgi:hypothetical protein
MLITNITDFYLITMALSSFLCINIGTCLATLITIDLFANYTYGTKGLYSRDLALDFLTVTFSPLETIRYILKN